MAKFQKGDVVVLKSGGPKMTVANDAFSHRGEEITCIWFNEVAEMSLSRAVFEEATLQLYDAKTAEKQLFVAL